MMVRTDRLTPDRFIDPVVHTMRTVSITLLLLLLLIHARYSALETFVIIALYKSTFTIPYHYHTCYFAASRGGEVM